MTPEPLLPNEAGPDVLPHDNADHDHSRGTPGHVHPPEASGARHGDIPVGDW
jgi:hypothetical protein